MRSGNYKKCRPCITPTRFNAQRHRVCHAIFLALALNQNPARVIVNPIRLGDDQFFLGNKHLHDCPCKQISDTANTEDDEVAGRFAFKAHELHIGFSSVGEEHTRTFVDKE